MQFRMWLEAGAQGARREQLEAAAMTYRKASGDYVARLSREELRSGRGESGFDLEFPSRTALARKPRGKLKCCASEGKGRLPGGLRPREIPAHLRLVRCAMVLPGDGVSPWRQRAWTDSSTMGRLPRAYSQLLRSRAACAGDGNRCAATPARRSPPEAVWRRRAFPRRVQT